MFLFVLAISASNVLMSVLNFISHRLLESCFEKVVKVKSNKMLNNSKKDYICIIFIKNDCQISFSTKKSFSHKFEAGGF